MGRTGVMAMLRRTGEIASDSTRLNHHGNNIYADITPSDIPFDQTRVFGNNLGAANVIQGVTENGRRSETEEAAVRSAASNEYDGSNVGNSECEEMQWTPYEEMQLWMLGSDDNYRATKFGVGNFDTWTAIASYLSRDVNSVLQKFEQLSQRTKFNSAIQQIHAEMPGDRNEHVGVSMHQQACVEMNGHASAQVSNTTGLPFEHQSNFEAHQDNYIGNVDNTILYHQVGNAAPHLAYTNHQYMADHQNISAEQMHNKYLIAAYMNGMNVGNMTEEEIILEASKSFTPQEVEMAVDRYQNLNGACIGDVVNEEPPLDTSKSVVDNETSETDFNVTSTENDDSPPNAWRERSFWTMDERRELLRLVQDPAYRKSVLEIDHVDWDIIGSYFGRAPSGVKRKFENIKDNIVHHPDGTTYLVLPENDGKKWSNNEVKELVKLVEDEEYRLKRLRISRIDWRVLGKYFGRSYESVSYKYTYMKNSTEGAGDALQKKAKPKHCTSYKIMAVEALLDLGGEGTSNDICDAISKIPHFASQLDFNIVNGKKTLQKWKHGVRSALNAFDLFRKTDRKSRYEVIWELAEEPYMSLCKQLEKKAKKSNQRIRSLPPNSKIGKIVPPFKKIITDPDGESPMENLANSHDAHHDSCSPGSNEKAKTLDDQPVSIHVLADTADGLNINPGEEYYDRQANYNEDCQTMEQPYQTRDSSLDQPYAAAQMQQIGNNPAGVAPHVCFTGADLEQTHQTGHSQYQIQHNEYGVGYSDQVYHYSGQSHTYALPQQQPVASTSYSYMGPSATVQYSIPPDYYQNPSYEEMMLREHMNDVIHQRAVQPMICHNQVGSYQEYPSAMTNSFGGMEMAASLPNMPFSNARHSHESIQYG